MSFFHLRVSVCRKFDRNKFFPPACCFPILYGNFVVSDVYIKSVCISSINNLYIKNKPLESHGRCQAVYYIHNVLKQPHFMILLVGVPVLAPNKFLL